jgi:ADP-ribosyl-[dinitrogen reductase] hydrolase
VHAALDRFVHSREPWCGSTDPWSAGNGSIMRLVPVPLFYAGDPAAAIARAADSSRTTHGTIEAVDACRYLSALIVGAVEGRSKDELLQPRFTPTPGAWEAQPLAPAIDAIARGSFRDREPPAIAGTGYVVASLEAALWAFAKSTTFAEGALLAVDLGDDADTTGAVYGQIAGAYYGVGGIPPHWVARLALRDRLEAYADDLLRLGGG